MCHPSWLFSRKYGTVWYHPASSKLWYLTALSFVNFQEKLTGMSFTLCAWEASFVRLAVWLALSALFASTTARSTSALAPFAVAQSSERVQLAAANGTGRWGHLSTQMEQVTFCGEREWVLLLEQEWPSFCGERERVSGVKRIRNRHTHTRWQHASPMWEKRRPSVPIKGNVSYKHASPVRTYQ
jgi:hypothetical protein